MKNNLLLTILIFFGLVCSGEAIGQEFNLQDLDDKIKSLIPPAITDTTPGLVVGIVHKGELVYSKGYGMANVSYNIPNDPKMIYNLGSVSKQFLGYAFAILHAEGQINVDDPVGKYLEDWPEFDQKVTVRHLLTHTSGYREAYTMSNLAGRIVGVDRLTKKECLDVVRKQPQLEFIPGSRFSYNSTAWVILAEILEEVTKLDAAEWVEENMIRSLGMNNTYIESFVGEVMPNAAESYYHDNNQGYGNSKSNRAIFGAAEVYSSVEDMVHWINNFKTIKVGSTAAMDLFLDPFELNDGKDSEYGFGINNGLHKGLKCYKHTGAHESFLTQLRYYPEKDLGIFTVSNFGGNGWLPTNTIAEYLLEDYMIFKENVNPPAIEMSVDKLKQFEGVYLSPLSNKTTNLVLVNDTLTVWGGLKLIPIASNTFYAEEWGGKFEIKTTKDGTLQLHVLGDNTTTFEKVVTWEPTTKELKEYEANYWSEELETVYHLRVKDDQLTIEHRWLGEIGLQPVTYDLFQTDWGHFIQVVRKEDNSIAGFNVHSGRTLNVFFGRK